MKLIKADEYFEECLKKETDYKNPTCKNCNECCGIHSSISKTEYKMIRSYIRRKSNHKILDSVNKRIRERNNRNEISLVCPFSNENKKCDIYNIRPLVCRGYHCSPGLKSERLEIRIKKNKFTIGDIFGFGLSDFTKFLEEQKKER